MRKLQLQRLREDREGLTRQPLVELYGMSRVLIENHQGVLAYAPTQIKVKVSYGCVTITGDMLELTEMNREQLVICGKIQGFQIERR